MAPSQRFAHVEALAERGLLEFAVIDPGSVNFTTDDDARPSASPPSPISIPKRMCATRSTSRRGTAFQPAFAIYEPGFTRAGAALARATGVKTPIYRFMFSETFAFGFPPQALCARRASGAAARRKPPRAVDDRGPRGRCAPLIAETVARGGHVRVGLEDAPLGTSMSNLAWVEDAVRLVREAGGEPATARRCARARAPN